MARDFKEHRFEWHRYHLLRCQATEGAKVNTCKQKAKKVLEIKVMFEPSRVATKCLIEAYSQIVPIPKWEAGQACKTENEDLPRKQAGGRKG